MERKANKTAADTEVKKNLANDEDPEDDISLSQMKGMMKHDKARADENEEYVLLEVKFRQPRDGCKTKRNKTWKDYKYRGMFRIVSSGKIITDWVTHDQYEPLEEFLKINKPKMYRNGQ